MKLNLDLFKVDPNKKIPEKGVVLVSEPFLKDSYFTKSVVLITEHNDNGSVGFILNQKSNFRIKDFIDDFPVDTDIFVGGPVDMNSLYYIHNKGNYIYNSVQITDDLYWGGNFEDIKDCLQNNIICVQDIRFFIGYSGWEKGQLEKELDNDYWIITKTSTQNILTENTNLWEDCLNNIGGKYKSWVNTPADPALN
ncbi:MAG: YqgE/AlgH family protein [Marinilabiliales bacterium]